MSQSVRTFTRVRDGKVQTVPGYERRRARPRWTDDDIIRAIQKWNELYGDPPAIPDWNPAMARQRGTPARQERYLDGLWPGSATVARHFGTWDAAIRAAGLEPRRPGPRDSSLSGSRVGQLSRRVIGHLRGRETSLVGPNALAQAVRRVAIAEKDADPVPLREALLDLAAVAVAWADRADR